MNNSKIGMIFFFVILITNLPPNTHYQGGEIATNNIIESILSDNTYVESSSIEVRHDDFEQPYVFPGSGTQEDPYVISGYNITNWNVGIQLRDNNAYTVISGNYIESNIAVHGIYAWNASNVIIENNIIITSGGIGAGISVHGDSKNIIIRDNYIFDSDWGVYIQTINNQSPPKDIKVENNLIQDIVNTGIIVHALATNQIIQNITIFGNKIDRTSIGIQYDSQGETQNVVFTNITLNQISDCGKGMELHSDFPYLSVTNLRHNVSHNIVLRSSSRGIQASSEGLIHFENNTVNDGGNDGFYLYQSFNNTIIGNHVSNNSLNGIKISYTYSEFNLVENNVIEFNSLDGLFFEFNANYNTVYNNTMRNNTRYGLDFKYNVNYNDARYNDFYFNYPDGESQATTRNTNSVEINYWNEWIEPDVNNDGIVDEAYQISSSYGTYDPFPLAYPNNKIHGLSSLEFISSISGTTISGALEIEWSPVIDSIDHQVLYSLFLSTDTISWIPLLENDDTTTFVWDTNTVENGIYYLKVIAEDGYGLVQEAILGQFSIENIISTSTSETTETSTQTSASSSTSTSLETSTQTLTETSMDSSTSTIGSSLVASSTTSSTTQLSSTISETLGTSTIPTSLNNDTGTQSSSLSVTYFPVSVIFLIAGIIIAKQMVLQRKSKLKQKKSKILIV